MPNTVPMRLSRFLVLSVAAALLFSACRRRKSVVHEAPPPTEATVAAPEPAQIPVVVPSQPAHAPVPAETIETTQASNDAAYTREMEQTLNDFLGEYIRTKQRIPRDINEMISLKIITSVPPLPGGKQWVIDQPTGRISAR